MLRIVRQTKQVAAQARSLAILIVELAQVETKRRGVAISKAAGMGIAAGVLVFYAVGLLLGAAVAGLSETLALWLSLLIVALVVLLLAALLVVLARRFAREASPPVPSQAIDEAKRTAERLQSRA